MNINKSDTAVVFIDPQNEVLSDKGPCVGVGRTKRHGERDRREHGAALQGGERQGI